MIAALNSMLEMMSAIIFIMIGAAIILGLVAVSYTHLDVYKRQIVFCGSSEIKRVKIKNRRVQVLKDTDLKRKLKWKLRFSFNKFSGKELELFERRLQEFTNMNGKVKRKHKKQVKSLK